ncbi:MAG: hypothetical protein IJT59_02250, partial [Desulfovibrionaceae bacterium]|nr:hypothetical protein [Desulfovibrionaceae bacterium]
ILAINSSQFEKIVLSNEQIHEIRASIAECGNACREMELSETHVNALAAVISKYTAQVELVWKSAASEKAAPIESYLNALMSLLDKKGEAQMVLNALHEGVKATPSSEAIETLSQNLEKAQRIADGYKLTPAIKSFLDKVRDGKATFGDITEEVYEWICQENMSRRIRLSF